MHVRYGLPDLICHLLISEEHSGWSAPLFESHKQIIRVAYGAICTIKGDVELASNLLQGCVCIIHDPKAMSKQIGYAYGGFALKNGVSLRDRGIRRSCVNRQKSVANHALCIDCHDRVGSNQAMKLLVDLHLYAKLAIR